jgi:fidgetin-like protein 1
MYFLVYCVNLDLQDFENALQEVRPSVSSTELGIYEEWNRQFGSLSI